MGFRNGAVAQLGERRNGIAEVRGSIPLGSTIIPAPYPARRAAAFEVRTLSRLRPGEALLTLGERPVEAAAYLR